MIKRRPAKAPDLGYTKELKVGRVTLYPKDPCKVTGLQGICRFMYVDKHGAVTVCSPTRGIRTVTPDRVHHLTAKQLATYHDGKTDQETSD